MAEGTHPLRPGGPAGDGQERWWICRYSISGAVGSGVGSVFPFLGFFLPGPLGFIGMIFGFALNGFAGGMAIAMCAGMGSGAVLPGIAFGVGFIPTAVTVMVTMVAEVGGSEALLFSASGCAVGYGIAGVIGTPFLGFALGLRRLRTLAFLLLAGGIALGIGGAVGGVALTLLGSAAHPFRGLAGDVNCGRNRRHPARGDTPACGPHREQVVAPRNQVSYALISGAHPAFPCNYRGRHSRSVYILMEMHVSIMLISCFLPCLISPPHAAVSSFNIAYYDRAIYTCPPGR